MSDGLIWLLAGLGLVAIEAAAPGAFMVWLGLAAIGAGLIQLASGIGFALQVACFAVLAALSLTAGLTLRRRRRPSDVNTQEAGLVGRAAVALAFRGSEGRVRVGDSDWAARLAAGTPPPAAGAALRVVAVQGTVLVVGAPVRDAGDPPGDPH